MARAITLIEKEMMEEIFNERLRDKKGMITVYEEFQDEIMKYEQRKRAVSAMLGPASTPTPPPARAPAPAGAGRGLGGGAGRGRGDRGRGAVRQIATGRGRGGGGQGATPLSAQDGARTPGQGADGLPKYVKDIMPHPLWKTPPYDSCRMPPMCSNGKHPCVKEYYTMSCQRCDKPLPTCMYREQPREQNPAVLQETRDNDPHYKEFEEASKNLGGNGQAGFMTPTPGATAGSGARAQRASQRAARRVGRADLEERVDALTDTLAELIKQGKAPAIRKAKSPKTQASSSSESESGSESEEVSSDESVDPHKANPLPPTSVAGSSPSRKSKQQLESLITWKEKEFTKDDVLPCEEGGPIGISGKA